MHARLSIPRAGFGVQRMHLEGGDVDQKARPINLIVQLMLAQHVANILAKETFDALSKFLDAVDVLLGHAPRCRPGRPADAA